MPEVLLFTPGLIIAGVLLVSGVAKLRHPDDEAGWRELGMPAALRHPFLIKLHPVGEVLLALGVAGLGGWLGAAAALAATVLFITYLVVVSVAYRRTPGASCACFGERQPISAKTLVRNSWLVLVSAFATFGAMGLPTIGGPVAASLQDLPALIALAFVAITVGLVFESGSAGAQPAPRSQPAPTEDDRGDYLPRPIPAVPLMQGDGTMVNLQRLAAAKPILLLAVTDSCFACVPVIEGAGAWRERVPELSVRFLVSAPPDVSALTVADGDQTLHDPDFYVRDSMGGWKTPTALLLGTDRLVAGGPVVGEPAIAEFVDEIYAQLHAAEAVDKNE